MTLFRMAVRGAAVVALTTALAGCAPVRVNSFTERGADVTRYRSYAWAPDERLGTGDPRLDNNPFFHDYLRAAVDRALATRGLERTSPDAAEALLHHHASVTQEIVITGDDRRDTRRAETYDAGTVLIDIVDARTNRLAWRGWAEGSFDGLVDSQPALERAIDDAVERIMATLPPAAAR